VTMTMGVAREFATQGIRALSISPGPVKTPFQDAAASSPELVQRCLDDVPMKRFGEPEEIGELVLFMCSDACEFMTADTVYSSVQRGQFQCRRERFGHANISTITRPNPALRWRQQISLSCCLIVLARRAAFQILIGIGVGSHF
jgi:Enoyl-(Acyl carrier protein) reductase